jgi:molybdopterin/thiamine biosynthesis adenylyltransferase
MVTLLEAIHSRAAAMKLPFGGNGLTLENVDIADLANEYSIPGHIVEATALKAGIYPLRYVRNMNSITPEGQHRLLGSSIALVGLGGLGGSLLDHFLRSGVGTLRCADGDRFETSNLNRQSLCTNNNLSSGKTDAALRRAAEVNPSVTIETTQSFLDKTSMPSFTQGVDVVVDALGGLKNRLALQKAAATNNIPMVTGALAGWTGYVSVVLPGKKGPADIMGENNSAEETLGCPAPAVSFIASLMANEIMRLLIHQTSPLTSAMLIVDLKKLSFEKVTL